jgi:hypothetical protein
MKNSLFTCAVLIAFLLIACGGEKKEDQKDEKKEEKKEITEETKNLYKDLQTEFSKIDAQIQEMTAFFGDYNVSRVKKELDSIKSITMKAGKNIQQIVMPYIDTLLMFNAQVDSWRATAETEIKTWKSATEEFTKVVTTIEKGEGDDEEIASQAEGFKNRFTYKQETIEMINKQWRKVGELQTKFKSLLENGN